MRLLRADVDEGACWLFLDVAYLSGKEIQYRDDSKPWLMHSASI